MNLQNDLSYMSTVEMAERISRRELSSVEILETVIERIDARNRSINAIVFRAFDDALVKAKEADESLRKGELLGSLHGIPTVLKDLVDYKPGWPATAGGIPSLSKNIVQNITPYAAKLEKAGAILIGSTNAPVMGFRATCDNYLYGPTRNPFDTTKNSGGSSGGSAAAVADGLVPFAQGTDGGGSIRIPSSWCGVYGYQASFGRIPFISRPNAFGGDAPFLYIGPITRTVADAALVLSVVAGFDPRDPYSLSDVPDFIKALALPVGRARMAYSPNFDVFPVDPEVKRVVDIAVSAIRDAGIAVDEVKLGIKHTQNELSDAWFRLILPFAVMGFEGIKDAGLDIVRDHPSDIPPELLKWLEVGRKMTAMEFCRAQELRSHVYDAMQNIFTDYDYIITPTMACLPVDNSNDGNTLGPSTINGEAVDNLIGYCLTYFTNFSGHPAATLPAGLSRSGLPVGMQIIGRRNADTDLLAMSAFYEKIRPWQESYSMCEKRDL